jgi:serine/threonine protein kinase
MLTREGQLNLGKAIQRLTKLLSGAKAPPKDAASASATRKALLKELQDLVALFSGILSPEEIQSFADGVNNAQPALSRRESDSISSSYAAAPELEGLATSPVSKRELLAIKLPAVSTTQNKVNETPALITERYFFLEPLGQGSEGRVISVNDRLINRTVALKTLLPNNIDEQTKKRFLNEAQLTAKLEHPSIVPVYDLGVMPDGLPFYTMRVVKQLSLKEIFEDPKARSQWSLTRLCGVFVQVCRAMAYAHARGVVHRDLKPGNILLGDYGEVYVADWGIARILGSALKEEENSQDGATRVENEEGLIIGSPGYMSPEQARSDWANLDHRSDLFSLGVILFELLTNQRPFQGKTSRAVLLATLGQDPTPPKTFAPNCPLVLEDLCLKLLSKDKTKRPSSAEQVAMEVEAFLEGAKEKERRRQEAERLSKEASVPAADYVELGRERDRLLRDARQLLRDVKPYDSIEKKRPAWNLQQEA